MSTLADGMVQREIGAGRWKATGAARADVVGRERTTVPGVQRAPFPGRFCLVWNVTTPSRSRPSRCWGW